MADMKELKAAHAQVRQMAAAPRVSMGPPRAVGTLLCWPTYARYSQSEIAAAAAHYRLLRHQRN